MCVLLDLSVGGKVMKKSRSVENGGCRKSFGGTGGHRCPADLTGSSGRHRARLSGPEFLAVTKLTPVNIQAKFTGRIGTTVCFDNWFLAAR